MKKILFFMMMMAVVGLLMTGCTAANNISSGISEKTISGSGYVGIMKGGVDPVDKIPAALLVLVRGDYTSIAPGMEFIQYTVESDASIFNKDAVFTRTRLIFGSSEKKRIDAVMGSVAADMDARARIEAEKAKAAQATQ